MIWVFVPIVPNNIDKAQIRGLIEVIMTEDPCGRCGCGKLHHTPDCKACATPSKVKCTKFSELIKRNNNKRKK